MNKKGSLGYQMMSALKTIFHPGRSRFLDKMHRRDKDVIRGIGTMRNDSANLHQFARFIRTTWPDVKDLERVTPEMAQAYISELVRRERSGGWIGRVCSAIRKMDTACRKSGIFPKSMPALLPYKAKGGPGSFHAQTKTAAYTTEQAHLIIASIESVDPAISRLLRLMQAAGLRVNEASRLRAQDIDLSSKTISLNQSSNINRTKGGRSRVVHYQPESQDFIQEMQTLGEKNPTGHIFKDRNSLPDRARA